MNVSHVWYKWQCQNSAKFLIKNIRKIGIDHIAKCKGICYPSQMPHKVPSFFCDFNIFREKRIHREECKGTRLQKD